jgi:hypothetical protein
MRTTCEQRSEHSNGDESFHGVTSKLTLRSSLNKELFNELVNILPSVHPSHARGIISKYVDCKNRGETK